MTQSGQRRFGVARRPLSLSRRELTHFTHLNWRMRHDLSIAIKRKTLRSMRIPLTMLIYAVVGPPLGTATLGGLIMLHDRQWITPMLVYFWGGYILGTVPALVAGAWVANSGSKSFWSLARIGLIMGIVPAVLIMGANIPHRPLELKDVLVLGLGVTAITLVFLIPTLVCGVLARLGPQECSPSVKVKF